MLGAAPGFLLLLLSLLLGSFPCKRKCTDDELALSLRSVVSLAMVVASASRFVKVARDAKEEKIPMLPTVVFVVVVVFKPRLQAAGGARVACGTAAAKGLTTFHHDKAKVAKVNVNANPTLADRMQLKILPTIVFYKNGVEVGREVGVNRDAITNRFKSFA